MEDFDAQANILIQRFHEKGYALDNLVKLKLEIMKMDRKKIYSRKKLTIKTDKRDIAFITGFNSQYKAFERIMKKYWPILKEDRVLSNILPNKPRFVYRKAPTLRNHLLHNVIDPPKPMQIFPDMKGFYRCQRCLPCKASKKQPRTKESFRSLTDHREYQIKHLITYHSTHVTYVIECPCHLQYVGRTTRPQFVRIREHIKYIRNGFPKHNLSRHFDEVHQRGPSGLIFYGIDLVEDHWRGGNKQTLISRN